MYTSHPLQLLYTSPRHVERLSQLIQPYTVVLPAPGLVNGFTGTVTTTSVDVRYLEDADVTTGRGVAAENTLRSTLGLHNVFVAVTSRLEAHLAPHTFLEDLLHLVTDLSTDSQKALEGHKPRTHDLYHVPGLREGALVDVLVNGLSQLLG